MNIENVYDYILGYKIKYARIKRDLTQKELAKTTGIDQGDISKMEKGIFNSSMKSIIKVSKALDADITIDLSLR